LLINALKLATFRLGGWVRSVGGVVGRCKCECASMIMVGTLRNDVIRTLKLCLLSVKRSYGVSTLFLFLFFELIFCFFEVEDFSFVVQVVDAC